MLALLFLSFALSSASRAVFGEPVFTQDFTIVIPSTIDTDVPYNNSCRLVRGVARMLSELNGGCTSVPARGYYVSRKGSLVEEDVTLLTSSRDRFSLDDLDEMKEMAVFVKNYLRQEAVLVKVGSSSYFV